MERKTAKQKITKRQLEAVILNLKASGSGIHHSIIDHYVEQLNEINNPSRPPTTKTNLILTRVEARKAQDGDDIPGLIHKDKTSKINLGRPIGTKLNSKDLQQESDANITLSSVSI